MNGIEIPSEKIRHKRIKPAVDREAMAEIELRLEIPPGGVLLVRIKTVKAFMRSNDFPPDVSRGLDLPASVVKYRQSMGPVRTIHTESILVPMPFPDNSMPFNTITYMSTLVALTAGAFINLVAMRPKKEEGKEEKDERKEVEGTVEDASAEENTVVDEKAGEGEAGRGRRPG